MLAPIRRGIFVREISNESDGQAFAVSIQEKLYALRSALV